MGSMANKEYKHGKEQTLNRIKGSSENPRALELGLAEATRATKCGSEKVLGLSPSANSEVDWGGSGVNNVRL